jgi:hypothetical protein
MPHPLRIPANKPVDLKKSAKEIMPPQNIFENREFLQHCGRIKKNR